MASKNVIYYLKILKTERRIRCLFKRRQKRAVIAEAKDTSSCCWAVQKLVRAVKGNKKLKPNKKKTARSFDQAVSSFFLYLNEIKFTFFQYK